MTQRARIISIAPDADPTVWRQALADCFWTTGAIIKEDDHRRQVWRVSHSGQDFAVKVRPIVGILGRCRVRFGNTDFTRARRAADLLAGAGFITPAPVIHAEVDGFEILVTPWVEAPTVLQRWTSAGPKDRPMLARAVGELVGRLSRKGLFNRDAKPSNLLWLDPDIALLDIGGVRRCEPASTIHLARMISALGFEPVGTGHAPNAGEIVIAVRAAIDSAGARPCRCAIIERLRIIIQTHGDPTPRHDPLAPEPNRR
ncbi:MAG TPA: hypothetical protein ENJ00_10195 [Phycisphaerales bacterium]|nr:hypothetical protein [Phycisphaerales bacterium]